MVEKGRYRLLLKNLPDAFAYHQMITDDKGNPKDYIFLEINPAFENMTGLQEEQVLGKRVTEVHPQIIDSAFDWIGAYGRVAAGRGDLRFESYFEPLERWYEITAYSDEPGYFATVFRDITESKQFHDTLRESEENLFITLQSIGDGVIATDLNTKITRMNPQAEKLTGWTFQEAAGRTLDEVFRIVHAKTGEPAFNPVHHVLKTGEILKLANDTALIARDGNRYQIADSAAPIRDGDGKITGAIMVFSDVTEQYQARKELEETTQRLEHVLRATQTGIDIIDENFNLLYVDNLWQDLYGAYEGRKCYEYFKGRAGPCENCGAPRALETKEVAFSEQVLPREDNRVVECHTVPFQNEQGAWLVAEFKKDITRLKQAEEKLNFQLRFEKMVSDISSSFIDIATENIDEMIKRSLQQIGRFFKADRSVIFKISPEGESMNSTHEWCSTGTKPLLGVLKSFSVNELPWLFTQIQKLVPFHVSDTGMLPPEAEEEKKGFMYQGIRSFLILPFFIERGGSAHGFLAIDSVKEKKTWTDEQIYLLSIVAEIIAGAFFRQQLEEERNRVQEMLKLERHIFEDVLESTLSGYWDWDLKTNNQYLSPAFKEMFGYADHEMPNRPESWQRIIFEEDLPGVLNLMEEHYASKGRIPFSIEVRYHHKNGSTIWVICAGRVIEWDKDGRPRRMVGCHVDITKLKQAEKALKESEENLSIILNSIGDGVIATDLHGNITRLNPKAEELTGWTQEDARGLPLTEVFHIIDAKTGEPAFNPVHHVLKTGKGIGLANDTALIARDGTRYQIGDSAAPIRDSKGKITGVVMVFSDVSEQYAAREALKKSEARYRTIVENTNDALFVRDFKGEILDLNDTACRLLGYKREELLGINLAAIRSPEEQARTSERLGQLLKENKLLFEGTLMHKNGSPIPVEISQAVISREGDGLIQSFARDITGRKRNEQQIAAYTAKLEGLYQKLEAEMNKAREVHKRTLPKELPVIKGISLAAHYQPAEELGGDFYDVVQRGKKLVIYLSDVTGHGADGAMLSVFVKHTIKGYLSFAPEEGIRPEKILRYLSAQFHQKNLPPEYFICTFLAVLDLETKELTYTAAGFQDAPLVRLGNGKRLKLMSKGLFLSPAFPDELLNLQEKSIHLTPGTTVFFNTDGLTEQGAKNTYYGTRLPAVFYENCHLPPSLLAQTVCEDFRNFNGGSLQGNDDITFLILQIDPNPKKIKRLELSSDFAELEHLRTKVSGILGNHKEVDLFLACLHELASNAIEHGNRLDKEKTVSVEIVITDRFIQGSVEDQGEGFNWRNQIDKPLELEGVAERGRGIAMARICSRHLLYNDKGNRATFILKGLKEDNNHAS